MTLTLKFLICNSSVCINICYLLMVTSMVVPMIATFCLCLQTYIQNYREYFFVIDKYI